MAIYESDIRKTKLWLGFLISADVINVWMYEESANSASSRTPTLAKILLRPMQHSIFSGNSSMFSLDSALRNGQPFFCRMFKWRLSPARRMSSTKFESQSWTDFTFEAMRAVIQLLQHCEPVAACLNLSFVAWWKFPMTAVILFCWMTQKVKQLNNHIF